MLNEKEYLKWIDGKRIVKYSTNGDSRFLLIEKNGIPDMQFMIMLFYKDTALKTLSQIYTNEDSNYDQEFYNEHISMLNEQTVVGSYLGNQICVDASGQVYLIDRLDFDKTFVNESFDDFINFFMLIDRILGHVNCRVIVSATKEQVEMVRYEMEKIYHVDWAKYVFWDKITRKLTKENISVTPVVISKPKSEKQPMQTIVITLDASKMTNPDLDIRYQLSDRIDEYTEGKVRDNGYDYLSENVIGIWLETDIAANQAEKVINLIREEKFADNDLSTIAEIYISEIDCAKFDACRKVYPS